jgi:hypothetical protein
MLFNTRLKTKYIFALLTCLIMYSCKKDAGDGGTSSITGKVHVTEYESDFQTVKDDYPGADVDVYIMYGNSTSPDDNTKTGPDGEFIFKYLREGDYKLYVYSDADTASGQIAVIKNIKISGRKKTVDAGIIEIKKK